MHAFRERSEIRLYELVGSRSHREGRKEAVNPRTREIVWQSTSKVKDWPNCGISNTLARPFSEYIGVILGYRPTLSGHCPLGRHEVEETIQLWFLHPEEDTREHERFTIDDDPEMKGE